MSAASEFTASDTGRAASSGQRQGPGTALHKGAASGNGQNQSQDEGTSIGVILGFPREIADELRRWRASFGDPLAATVPAHITLVTTTVTQDWEATCRHVRDVARRQKPFTVTIAGTGSFRPVSPVVFLKVEAGFRECVSLHRKLQAGPLQRDLPFPYHPHVTVAHDVAPECLDKAERALKNYRASFPVASMGLYEHDDNGIWQLREELDFGIEPDDDRGRNGAAGAR
jgi:2'-5' RNA ligase